MVKQTLDSIIARTIMSRDGITAIETKAYTTPVHIRMRNQGPSEVTRPG